MAMNVVAFRHTIWDELGSLATALQKTGADYSYIDTYYDDLTSFDALGPDLLVVLGGAPGVYQSDHYPFIAREISIIEQRLAAGLPVLGICLGAQMMAKALGADVYVGAPGPEKGWHPIRVNDAGKDTPVRHFDESCTSMLHWHGDTFDLPDGATLLASSALYQNQIYSWGKIALGLQCHVEITPKLLKSCMVDAADEVATGKLDLKEMEVKTAAHCETLMRQSELFFQEWTGQIQKERENA